MTIELRAEIERLSLDLHDARETIARREAVIRILETDIAAAERRSVSRKQYYYRTNGCKATGPMDPLCICWHDQGTGPQPEYVPGGNVPGTSIATSWRDKPSEPVKVPARLVFPTHLRKMWSGSEVQAWLDEQMGAEPQKTTAKGSLERYRQWQTDQAAPQPAEPVKRKRPYAQGTALSEFGVIPMCDQVSEERR